MAFRLTALSQLADAGFDDLIDARAPAEFADDHLPGAINLPVLDDQERARVGTIYVQQSRFDARKIGAALVVRNVARHLETVLAGKDGSWRPLVYCWRGGQRSGTFGWLLKEVGWRAETLEGGYRTYRRLVVNALYETAIDVPLVVLDGMTCTAKTRILHLLDAFGVQIIDLEGMAHHRGSVFGGHKTAQPSQKTFESRLALALAHMDPARPIVIEAESSKVGDLLVPPQLWKTMCAAPRIRVEAPISARANFFCSAYPDLVADPGRFSDIIGRLVQVHGRETVGQWQELVTQGRFADVAAALMATHYDPRYAKSAARHAPPVAVVNFSDLADGSLEAGMQDLVATIESAAHP